MEARRVNRNAAAHEAPHLALGSVDFDARTLPRADEDEIRTHVVGGLKFVQRYRTYAERSRRARRGYDLAKRVLDASVAAVLLLLALPWLALIALLVKLGSPGPVLFRQRRLGMGGREFWCLKFRTMVPDAEARLKNDPRLRARFEASYKLDDDPRITPLGKVMRRTSIDELPQLWNVLVGDMSLVGPRPIVPPELEKYGIFGRRLLRVRPGLSGVWQTCGRSDTTYPERVLMDMLYIEHRCLALDVRLLWRTAGAVIRKQGAR